MARLNCILSVAPALLMAGGLAAQTPAEDALNHQLSQLLTQAGFTGKIDSTLEARLGRKVDPALADLGRLLFFDKILALHSDNSCAGCHAPGNGFGDTQSIAIGVQNNNVVGPRRTGPRNQRRTPMLVNDSFYPRLMWNGRFFARSNDPFDNSQGFHFPAPEGDVKFPAHDAQISHLLIAQAHMPPTEQTESAGFTGNRGSGDPMFDIFDDGLGSVVPAPDASGYRNEPIRQAVLERLNLSAGYRPLFARNFPEVAAGGPITYVMAARAIAEFQHTIVFADAPVDRFARGQQDAMNAAEKRGALLFFGSANCVSCHAVSGTNNEMFSDFDNHRLGVPQLAPPFGVGSDNVLFDGPAADEDFGAEQITADPNDRYKFRSSPLRNLALQPSFFHDGAFTRLEDAIAHHLNPTASAMGYDPALAGMDPDLRRTCAPQPLLRDLDPGLKAIPALTADQVSDIAAFLRRGLFDQRAAPENLCRLVPHAVPSGLPLQVFEGCAPHRRR